MQELTPPVGSHAHAERDIDGPRTLALGAGVIVSALGALFVLVLISLSQTDW